jgi:hypothetical protein
MHDPEICRLNRVVGIKGIRDPMLAVIVSTSSYLDFISYAVTLTTFRMIGLERRRLSSCIVSWIWGGVPLDVGSVTPPEPKQLPLDECLRTTSQNRTAASALLSLVRPVPCTSQTGALGRPTPDIHIGQTGEWHRSGR